MTSRRYGFAIVGAGVIAPFHARAIQALPNAVLRAIVDVVPEIAQQRAAEFGVDAYSQLDPVLERADVDVVCITTPTGLHAALASRAAEAGKHVVVEKPIDVSLEAADRLIATCRRAGVTCTVISQRRWDLGMQLLKQALDQGLLGSVFLADVSMKWYRSQAYYDSAAWRGTWELDGGGALMNQGVHFVDLLLWLLGPVKRVYATCTTVAHTIPVEDVAIAHLEFANGALGVIQATTAAFPGLDEHLEVTGTQGTIRVEKGNVVLWQVPSSNRSILQQTTASSAADPAALSIEGHRQQLADFLEAIEQDREPAVTLAQARAALEVILAAYTSAHRKAPVTLPLPSPTPVHQTHS